MSEPAPEPQGGDGGAAPGAGSFLQRKFLGIPAIVWMLGVAILAYLYFKGHKKTSSSSSSTGTATSTGGGGSASTGNISISPGTETIDINASSSTTAKTSTATTTTTAPNPQPTPTPKKSTSSVSTTITKKYTVQKGDTLASLAKKFGIDVACLAHNNVYVSGESKASEVGKPLGTGAGLKTGQVLKIPDNAQCKAMGYKS